MLATVAAADSASTVRKKYSVFIYSEAEPHAMYAIYKQTRTLCVLQYMYVISSRRAFWVERTNACCRLSLYEAFPFIS